MPLTTEALNRALEAGVKAYNTYRLGWFSHADGTYNGSSSKTPYYNKLLIHVYEDTIDSTGSLQAAAVKGKAFASSQTYVQVPTSGVPGGVLQQGSEGAFTYLNDSAVCSINKNGSVTKIVFALGHNDHDPDTVHGIGSGIRTQSDGIPAYHERDGSGDNTVNYLYGDQFLVITVSPGISVTSGGYLTIKGYSASEDSKLHTYITLEQAETGQIPE